MMGETGESQESRTLKTLLRVGVAVAAELDLEKAVQVVTDAATELTGAAFGSFFYKVADGKGESYMLYSLSGVPREAFSKFPMPRNTQVFAPTFAGEGVVRSDDITKDPRYGKSAPHHGQPKGHLPVHSYLAVPVVSRAGEVVGGLFFGHPEVGKFTAQHEEIVAGIAPMAAIAIDNAQLYRAARHEIARRKEAEAVLRESEAGLRRTNTDLMARASQGAEMTQEALLRLRDSERNFRLLVQSVTDYAIYMLDPTGVVASWNAGAARIKGYRAEEIVGKNFSQFFAEADREAGIPGIALKTALETGRYESEGWRLRKDGSRFWAFAVIDAVRDEEGNHIGFAKITRDMTERRDAQIQLERARDQLAQAQKMEAIGQLTGGIAHDFNNLLMIVSGQAQLMRNRVREPKDIRSLDAIEMAAKSGANLTQQLLTFARRQRLNPIVIDIGERLDAFRDLLVSSAGGAVKFTLEVASGTWPVEVDLSELELSLVNIAVNARDAMPSGGTLTLRAENASLDGRGAVALTGDFVELSLADNGEGIAPEIMARVFEPFFTTKEVGKGTGLGLAQVYGFARQSGGDVSVTSTPGQGATVSLYLPRSHGTPRLIVPKTEEMPMKGKGTVLVVEDNPQVAEVSIMLLEQLGFDVVRLDRPAPALDMLAARGDIALVFSDIVMPGDMDGLAFADVVRRQFPNLPVLLATGYSSAAERAAPHFPILRKPYDVNTLGAAVRKALADAV
jgi:PAS domain S-box-containing protein